MVALQRSVDLNVMLLFLKETSVPMTMQIFALLQILDLLFLTKYQVRMLAVFQDLNVSDCKCLRQKFTSCGPYVLYATNIVGPDISSKPGSTMCQIYSYYHYMHNT